MCDVVKCTLLRHEVIKTQLRNLRLQVESINIDEEGLALLGDISERTSLRHAVQVLPRTLRRCPGPILGWLCGGGEGEKRAGAGGAFQCGKGLNVALVVVAFLNTRSRQSRHHLEAVRLCRPGRKQARVLAVSSQVPGRHRWNNSKSCLSPSGRRHCHVCVTTCNSMAGSRHVQQYGRQYTCFYLGVRSC